MHWNVRDSRMSRLTSAAVDGAHPPAGAAMEGRGFYNAHSRPQHAAARHGIELLVQAAGQLDPGPPPLVIADYGSADTANETSIFSMLAEIGVVIPTSAPTGELGSQAARNCATLCRSPGAPMTATDFAERLSRLIGHAEDEGGLTI